MILLIGYLIFAFSFSAHELGHAFAMRRYNVPIARISLFGFGPKLFTFRARKFFGDTPISICLIPLGAYVEPVFPHIDLLSTKQQGHIYGGGVIASILYTGILMVIFSLITPDVILLRAGLVSGILLLIGLFPRITWRIVPWIGFAILVLLLYMLYSSPAEFQKNNGSVVTIGQEMAKTAAAIPPTITFIEKLSRMLEFVIALCLGVGVVQALPLIPLDGGRIVLAYLEKWFPNHWKLVEKIFTVITVIPFILLVISALTGDLLRIINMF